jgi:predicted ATP-grasp superfamily ATP-dependent carboligase
VSNLVAGLSSAPATLSDAPFAYCGSMGPVEIPAAATGRLRIAADALTAAAGLRGLFGVDFLLDGRTPWIVEINPRYTASVEILEDALRAPLLRWHEAACVTGALPPAIAFHTSRVSAKWIVYADRTLHIEADVFDAPPPFLPADELPSVADIPCAGTVIPAGQPLCTLLARGESTADCAARLAERFAALPAAIRPRSGPVFSTDLPE